MGCLESETFRGSFFYFAVVFFNKLTALVIPQDHRLKAFSEMREQFARLSLTRGHTTFESHGGVDTVGGGEDGRRLQMPSPSWTISENQQAHPTYVLVRCTNLAYGRAQM